MQVYGLKKLYIKDNIIAYNTAKDDLNLMSIRKVIHPRKSRVNPSLFNIKYIASKSFFV